MPRKEYDNTNRGVLFKNNDKETEKHPDMRGRINIEGTEHWLAAWFFEYEDKKGNKRRAISLSIGDPCEEQRGGGGRRGGDDRDSGRGAAPSGEDRRPGRDRDDEPAGKDKADKPRGHFDDMEDDIPFLYNVSDPFYAMLTARSTARERIHYGKENLHEMRRLKAAL
jgi:hypothetical protein